VQLTVSEEAGAACVALGGDETRDVTSSGISVSHNGDELFVFDASLLDPIADRPLRVCAPHKSRGAVESQLISNGIKNQIASDAASTMQQLLALFHEKQTIGDEAESQGSISVTSLGKVFVSCTTNESLRSAFAQCCRPPSSEAEARATHGPRVNDVHHREFAAAPYDVLLDTLAKRREDRFGVGRTAARGMSSEAQRQLAAQASRGFSTYCLQSPGLAASFPIAIIFAPLLPPCGWDSAEPSRFKCNVRCMLVGQLRRAQRSDGVLGHPDLSRAAISSSTTLTSAAVFDQEARHKRRLQRAAENQRLVRQCQREAKRSAEHEAHGGDADGSAHLENLAQNCDDSDGEDSCRDQLEALRESANLPPHLKRLLSVKAEQDARPLRAHKAFSIAEGEHVVSHESSTVEPHLLIVYEELDCTRPRPTELMNVVVTGDSWQSSAVAEVYSKLEYTLKWGVPIAEVGTAALRDARVRRRIPFPAAARSNPLPLNMVMAACKRGAVSIDVVDGSSSNQPLRFEYRHSFLFSKLKLGKSSW
jgi:hypothetical protein